MEHDRGIEMIGGDLALDFANTAGWHARVDPVEHLEAYADFVDWARRAGIVSAAQRSALTRAATRSPNDARRALSRVRELRETIYRVFTAVAVRRKPTPPDVAHLQRAFAEAVRTAAPRWGRDGVRLEWPADLSLDWPAHPIALAAGTLLTSPALPRLRQCGNHPCGWLFVDTSRNGSRRWCSSAECGNASRVRRFRARRR